MSPSASWAPGVFGSQALSRSDFLVVCHRRRVAGLNMLYKVNSNSNNRLFSKLPSGSTTVRQISAAVAAHPFEFEVSRCRTSQFTRSFLPALVRLWNDLPYTVFDTRTLYLFKGACSQPLVASLSCVFFSFPWGWCLWGCESNLKTILFFHT